MYGEIETFVGPKGPPLARHGRAGHWGGTSERLERCGGGEARSTDRTAHGPRLCKQLGEHGSCKEKATQKKTLVEGLRFARHRDANKTYALGISDLGSRIRDPRS